MQCLPSAPTVSLSAHIVYIMLNPILVQKDWHLSRLQGNQQYEQEELDPVY